MTAWFVVRRIEIRNAAFKHLFMIITIIIIIIIIIVKWRTNAH